MAGLGVFGLNRASEAQTQAATATHLLDQSQQRGTAVQISKVEADRQRDEAQRQSRVALSRQLAAQSLSQLGNQLDLALLLSLQAYRTSDTFESRSALAN